MFLFERTYPLILIQTIWKASWMSGIGTKLKTDCFSEFLSLTASLSNTDTLVLQDGLAAIPTRQYLTSWETHSVTIPPTGNDTPKLSFLKDLNMSNTTGCVRSRREWCGKEMMWTWRLKHLEKSRRRHNMQSALAPHCDFLLIHGHLHAWHRTKLWCVSSGSALLGPGRWVLSAAHVMVSVASAQTVLLCRCLGPSDGWQRLLSGGNEEARGEPGGQIFERNSCSPSYLRLRKSAKCSATAGRRWPACCDSPTRLIVLTRFGKRHAD